MQDYPRVFLVYYFACTRIKKHTLIQLNLSTTATLGTEESCHCREVAVIDKL